VLWRTAGSVARVGFLWVAYFSDGGLTAELSVRLDLSMDFGAPVFSAEVVVVADTVSTSVRETETTRAACEAVRGRAMECGDITWTGYGDS
jgi:hypothetical protein